jgi:hypothetical protein
MASDLTDETGIHEAGLDELLQALAGPASPAELAGEQAALAMFRNSGTSSTGAGYRRRAVAGRTGGPGQFATRQIRKPTRWNLRLVAATAVVLCGGMAAAAYAAALPAPVQRLAHEVFQFAGVPGSQAGSGGTGSAHGALGGNRTSAPASLGSPAPSAAAPSVGVAGPSAGTGAAVLSATADSTQITAGTGVLITAQLSWPGQAVTGLTITVLERSALAAAWHAVGSAPASAAGNAVVVVPVVGTDAVFRVVVPGVAISPPVRITVVPAVSVALQAGSGRSDVLTVSVPYGQEGDQIVLQVSTHGGGWTYLQQGSLTPLRRASFQLSATRLGGNEIRAVLLPTGLHDGSMSAPVTVPAG